MLGTYHLTVLYEVINDIYFIYDMDKLFERIVTKTIEALNAEAGSLFLLDDKMDELIPKFIKGEKSEIIKSVPFKLGAGICGWVAETGQPIIIDEPYKHPRFNRGVDAISGFKTKSIMVSPLLSKGKILGVIEILNKKSSTFNKNDLDLLMVISGQAAIAIENARLYTELILMKNFNECILENMTGGFIAIDPMGKIIIFNPSASSVLGIPQKDAIGKFLQDVLKKQEELADILWETSQTKQMVSRQEFYTTNSKEEKILVGYSTLIIKDKDGQILGTGMIFKDLTNLK